MFRYFLPVLALGLAGCAASPTSSGGASDARGLAAAFVAGRAYDLSQSALKGADDAALKRAGRAYARAAGEINDGGQLNGAVVPIVLAGLQLDAQSKEVALAYKPLLQARALAKYRAASAFLPPNPAPAEIDADTLNLVGYQLADRGTTRADWTRAELLTRLSLREWDRQIKALKPDDKARAALQNARIVGALDSHAWALFRLGQLSKARAEAEQVIAYAGKHPELLSAELPFHLAEIYRALGRTQDAQKAYQMALELQPDDELYLKIDSALNGTTI